MVAALEPLDQETRPIGNGLTRSPKGKDRERLAAYRLARIYRRPYRTAGESRRPTLTWPDALSCSFR
jgi:hypothetical protein